MTEPYTPLFAETKRVSDEKEKEDAEIDYIVRVFNSVLRCNGDKPSYIDIGPNGDLAYANRKLAHHVIRQFNRSGWKVEKEVVKNPLERMLFWMFRIDRYIFTPIS